MEKKGKRQLALVGPKTTSCEELDHMDCSLFYPVRLNSVPLLTHYQPIIPHKGHEGLLLIYPHSPLMFFLNSKKPFQKSF